ncbi:hypothetical protein PA598K_01674 [Paenibacillus sp. 598K]|uniref:TetR/AcrR family transcriptional regulator n=1 Tax=Paenibacillus sp. 598K TaxID=1117987 RepID=UPI000FF99E00|nr:TetR/AcrR family transcriptional regulator [Paenibacillus sp. 598K]GBF73387.1 hypothetical protein PA598K_01674 [Paenibacillus sp. 598K]
MAVGVKGERKREQILEKAKELFISQGYAATTMEDLVRYSGFSKGSIYYHFDSKEELFLQLLNKHNIEWSEAWRAREARYSSFSERIYGVVEFYIEDFYNPLVKVAEEFGMAQKNQDILDRLLVNIKSPRAIYAEILQEGVEAGLLRDLPADELAVLFAAQLDGLSIIHYEYDKAETERMYRLVVDCFLHGVLKPS